MRLNLGDVKWANGAICKPRRWYSYKVSRPVPTKEQNVARWHSHVDSSAGPDACHPWTRSKTERGYGDFQIDGKRKRSHRAGWELLFGPIPAGLFVCHTCDNPPCCNPRHWFLGTPLDNKRDQVRKGRLPMARPPRHRGETHPRAKLSAEDVGRIRGTFTGVKGEKAALARIYGVSQTQIGNVLSRRHWNDQD